MASVNNDNSGKIMLVSVVVALLIIGAAVAYVKFGAGGTSAVPLPLASGPQAERVEVPEDMSICGEFDESCIVVERSCGFCCDYIAINSKFERQFDFLFDEACARYNGQRCSCHDLDHFPKCVGNKCQLVEWPGAAASKPQPNRPVPEALPPPSIRQ